MTHQNDILGKWILLQERETYTIPTAWIEEFTTTRNIIYSFDLVRHDFPLELDIDKQGEIINKNNNRFFYAVSKSLLIKDYTLEDGTVNRMKYIRMLPTQVSFPIEKVLTKKYALTYLNNIGQERTDVLDFTNSNPRNTVYLTIEKLDDTYFITGTESKERILILTIKAIHKDYLIIYGFTGKPALLKEIIEEEEKEPVTLSNQDIITKSKLTSVLDELEEQLNELNTQIEKAAADWEFETAQHLADAYRTLNREYNSLAILENKYHDDIVCTKRLLFRDKKNLEEGYVEEFLVDLTQRRIEDYEHTLQRLRLEKPDFRPETFHIKKAIQQLVDGTLSQIKLILREKYDTCLLIQIEDQKLVFSISRNDNEMYLDCDFTKLKQLGFIKEETKYTLVIPDIDDDLKNVMNTLSRITFEAFHFKGLDTPMKMLIT